MTEEEIIIAELNHVFFASNINDDDRLFIKNNKQSDIMSLYGNFLRLELSLIIYLRELCSVLGYEHRLNGLKGFKLKCNEETLDLAKKTFDSEKDINGITYYFMGSLIEPPRRLDGLQARYRGYIINDILNKLD